MDVRISDAELEVMEALWAAGQPLTAAEVADRIDADRDWSLATVKTMLSRLAAKGALKHREDGRRFLYSPAIKREDYVGNEFPAVRRTVVRRPSIAAGRAAGRRRWAGRRGHRRDRGAAEGAEVVTDWLLGTLLATSGLIVLVLLIREPVRRHFGARVAYGLWLIPAARLLMPTMTQTVERPVPWPASPVLTFVPRSRRADAAGNSVAPPEPTLIDQLGGWPTILLTLWLGVAPACSWPACWRSGANGRRSLQERVEIGRARLDPPRPVARRQRPARIRNFRPGDRRPGRFRTALCSS